MSHYGVRDNKEYEAHREENFKVFEDGDCSKRGERGEEQEGKKGKDGHPGKHGNPGALHGFFEVVAGPTDKKEYRERRRDNKF